MRKIFSCPKQKPILHIEFNVHKCIRENVLEAFNEAAHQDA